MKKFFSFFAALLFAGSMMAQVTITPENSSWTSTAGAQTGTVEGVTVAVTNGVTGSTTAEGATMRIYKDATLTISSASNISKIVFNCVANNTTKYGPGCFGAQEGYSYDAKVGTWEGSATSVSFTASSAQVRATSIVVTLAEGGDPVVGNPTYYVAGSMNEWKANANYKLAANPAVDGEFMGEFTFKANDEFKVIMDNGSAEYTWYPAGTDNNWKITEDGDYKVYFRPAGNTEWANGYFDVMMKEKPVIPTYNVAEAIAAGLADNTEINVCGIITKMEFKGKNFAQYGSVNIYVADATGAEGTFEFYNCYSLNADTFKTSTPAYDATSTAWAEFTEVADANGNAIHIGDTVIAFGKYKLYNTTHELNTGCNLIEIKHKDAPAPAHTYTVAGAPSTVFGENWNPALEANDMQQLIGGDGYIWSKDTAEVSVGGLVFKVVEDHSWDNKAYPAENYILELEPAYYNIVITFNPAAQPDSMVKAIATKVGELPVVGVETVYNWAKDAADQVGTTILGGNSNISEATIKIHENTDEVPCLKFGSSFVYAEGKWVAIKPAEGKFLAGDTVKVAGVFSNDATDGSKYAQIDAYAADGATRLFRGDSVVNGKKSADDPVVEYFVLEADADSLFFGRYGNTGLFITLLQVVRGEAPVVEPVYTVVGSSAPLFGKTWDPTYEANNMEPITGSEYLYAWKKEGVALAAGTIEYKVCKDKGWNPAWPAQGNYSFNIAEDGLYDVAIFFNPDLETPTQVIAEKKGEVVVLPNIILHGNFTGTWADTEAFTPAADSLTASLTLALAEGTYEFGFKFDGTWKANGATITREANTANLATGSGNMKIAADVPGNYLFTYTYATQEVVVTYPEPIIVPDTVKIVVKEDLEWTDAVAKAGWWQIMGENEGYSFSLSNSYTTEVPGIYTVADLDETYSYVKPINGTDKIHFVSGQVVVAINTDSIITFVGALTGTDNKVYAFDLAYNPAAVNPYKYDEKDADFIYNFDSYKINTQSAAKGIVGISTNTDSTYISMTIILPQGQTTLVAGEYPVAATPAYQTVYAGYYDNDKKSPAGSMAATLIEQGGKLYYNEIWYLVSGKATVDADLNITVDALNSNSKLIKANLKAQAQGIEDVKAAQKATKSLKNGILVIEKNGVQYNVTGQEIR